MSLLLLCVAEVDNTFMVTFCDVRIIHYSHVQYIHQSVLVSIKKGGGFVSYHTRYVIFSYEFKASKMVLNTVILIQLVQVHTDRHIHTHSYPNNCKVIGFRIGLYTKKCFK